MKVSLVFLFFLSLSGFLDGAPSIGVIGLDKEDREFDIVDGDVKPDQEVTQFGDVLVKEQKIRRYRIVNNGTEILNLSTIKSSSKSYTIEDLGSSIPSRGSDDFTISFRPNLIGEIETTITIESNAPGELKSYTFALTGFGISAPMPSIAVLGIDDEDNAIDIADGFNNPNDQEVTQFGTVAPGEQNVRHYRIINSGESPLNISSIESSSDDFTVDGLGASIPPNEPDNFTITFSPSRIGKIGATITIVSNAPGDLESYTFLLIGE